MKIQEVAETLERFAPLPLQESYDNAGLQVGLTEVEASGVLLCLDVTVEVVREAVAKGCNMIVAHHPLLFRGLKRIGDDTLVERCVRESILQGVTLYAAHTNLDNAREGVNFEIAPRSRLQQVGFLESSGTRDDSGSGVVGNLPEAMQPELFLRRLKEVFHVECLLHNRGPQKPVCRIALCGGAGEFLVDAALRQKADVFVTGEMGYHRFFGYEDKMWLAVMGHHQSEQFTVDLMQRILKDAFPDLKVERTQLSTNPICYMK